MKTTLKIVIGSALVSFVIGGFIYANYRSERETIAHSEYSYDISNKENVTKSAKQLFVGTVNKRTENINDSNGGAYTRYSVDVVESLKGELTPGEQIIVSQSIGYDNKHKTNVKLEKDDDYLEEGSSYIFATSNIADRNIYQIKVPLYGNVKVKDNQGKDFNKSLINEYKEALKKNKEE